MDKLVFGLVPDLQSEIARDVAHEFERRKRGIEHQREGHVAALQQSEERPQDQRFARSYLARQDHEPAMRRHSVIQRSERLVVPHRRKKKRRVGSDLEGVALQIVESLIHGFEMPASKYLLDGAW